MEKMNVLEKKEVARNIYHWGLPKFLDELLKMKFNVGSNEGLTIIEIEILRRNMNNFNVKNTSRLKILKNFLEKL